MRPSWSVSAVTEQPSQWPACGVKGGAKHRAINTAFDIDAGHLIEVPVDGVAKQNYKG